jgi:hypothetical protein
LPRWHVELQPAVQAAGAILLASRHPRITVKAILAEPFRNTIWWPEASGGGGFSSCLKPWVSTPG